jgi:hypothetical protein
MATALHNPIVLRELLQTARRPSTFALRALAPFALLTMALPLVQSARLTGEANWRKSAELYRPVFYTCVWLQYLAVTVAAAGYGLSAVTGESRRRTLDVLRTTPVCDGGLVWGKYAAVQLRGVLRAAALLPVLVFSMGLGNLPPGTATNSLVVILGASLYFGALGLYLGARPGRIEPVRAFLALVGPYAALLVLGWGLGPPSPGLVQAAVSFVALAKIGEASPPTGWSVAGLAGTSFVLHAVAVRLPFRERK